MDRCASPVSCRVAANMPHVCDTEPAQWLLRFPKKTLGLGCTLNREIQLKVSILWEKMFLFNSPECVCLGHMSGNENMQKMETKKREVETEKENN